MEVINIKNIIFGEGNPKICVPLVEKTQDKIIDQVKKIKQTSADCLEWRCDFFEECENPFAVQQVLMQLRQIWEKPLIFTFRTLEEGGQKEINQKKYEQLLLQVSQTKEVDIIDVEYQRCSDDLLSQLKMNGWVLLSYHNFKETPTSLQTLFMQMDRKNVDFLKIAVMPQNEKDVDDLLCAAKWAKQNSKACIVAIAMGELGKRSRISKDTCLTFASVDQNSAPGQIPLDEMVAIFEEKNKSNY